MTESVMLPARVAEEAIVTGGATYQTELARYSSVVNWKTMTAADWRANHKMMIGHSCHLGVLVRR